MKRLSWRSSYDEWLWVQCMFVSSIAPMMRVDSLSLYAVSSILSFAVFLSLSWCIFYFIHCRHKVIFVTETSKYKKLTVFLLMTRQFWDYFELALKDAIMSNSLRAPLSYFYNFRKLHSLNLNSISMNLRWRKSRWLENPLRKSKTDLFMFLFFKWQSY